MVALQHPILNEHEITDGLGVIILFVWWGLWMLSIISLREDSKEIKLLAIIACICFVISAIIAVTTESAYLMYGKDAIHILGRWLFIIQVFVPYSIPALATLLSGLAANSLLTIEQSTRNRSWWWAIPYFLAFFISPIGVWFLQPRINRAYAALTAEPPVEPFVS
jgi:hypothetical protein